MTNIEMHTREKLNLKLFIVSYGIINLISGVMYDTYVNYLQEVSIGIATSFWSFYGVATFISALLLFAVPKVGYKRILMFCSISTTLAMLSAAFINNENIFYITTMLALVGVQLHFVLINPYIAAYTEQMNSDISIKWYSRAYYIGYIGYFLSTFLGGVLVVKLFQIKIGSTYEMARSYTTDIENLAIDIKLEYLSANQQMFLIMSAISALCIIPVIMIKEEKSDYRNLDASKDSSSIFINFKDLLSLIKNQKVVIYLIYWSIISFSMGLFTSYYTVYLNRNLHIDKATSSLMVSISYIAIVLFIFLSPILIKKVGRVITICITLLSSIPFMITIGLGEYLGSAMIPVVGIALFMRAGLANLGTPAEGSLTMSIVNKDLRPAFVATINIVAGSVSILSGIFTGNILFAQQEGYRNAYFIASGLYLVCVALVFFGFRKYNRGKKDGEV